MTTKTQNNSVDKNQGSVTLPAETGKEKEVLELANRWSADAIRDSDGTQLPDEMLTLGYDIYSTICLVRADQEWPRKHPDMLPQKFLMSDPVVATSTEIEIDPMAGYFREKYKVDTNHDPKKYWQVFDRTTGQEIPCDRWVFQSQKGKVVVKNVQKFHLYTVNFLVYQIWDSTSMYNHLINNWDKPHVMCTEPYHARAREHLMRYFDNWLAQHEHTSVVRLTTLAYHFTLDSDENAQDKYRDWLGYMDTITVEALEDFAREYGYRLCSEDFVDMGYYNATYRVPKQKYRDWMAFVHRFVVDFGKELVEKVHKAGKKAAIFWGDHWIGTEPYSPLYQEMGIDINIGACEDGVALRRVADAPGNQIKEVRLYPYFFPDVFRPGGNPLAESQSNWVKIRRALLRKHIDRIGYGGYPSLAMEFPEFIKHVENLCNEFREILNKSGKTESYKAPVKVAVLNAWGKLRSWINNTGRAEKFQNARPDITYIAGSNVLECLAGLPVEIEFISFDDIKNNGIADDITVIINDGDAGTAWSGGDYWKDEAIVSCIRQWVYEGGAFLGVGEPSACEYQGRFFQMADVMGVQKETGQSSLAAAKKFQVQPEHFITEDGLKGADFFTNKSYVYSCDKDTVVLSAQPDGHINLAVHEYGKGRAGYLSGMFYNLVNARILLRSIFWLSRQEKLLYNWFSSNQLTDCAAYPQKNCFVVINNVDTPQDSTIYKNGQKIMELTLPPYQSHWFEWPA